MLLGVTGKAGCGKNTLANFLIKNHNFIEMSFADTIKDMACVLLNVNREQLEELKINNAPLLGTENITARYILQTLGTEWGRNLISRDIWINNLRQKIINNISKNIIITDVRFPNEFEMLTKLGFHFIKIIPKKELLHLKEDNNHESESYDFKDCIIINNFGTLEDFESNIKLFIEKYLEF